MIIVLIFIHTYFPWEHSTFPKPKITPIRASLQIYSNFSANYRFRISLTKTKIA